MFRLIGRLDLKFPNVVKGINLEGTRKVGEPYQLAQKYYNEGIDELIIADIIASHYSAGIATHLYNDIADNIFVPTILSGGVITVVAPLLIVQLGLKSWTEICGLLLIIFVVIAFFLQDKFPDNLQ